MDILKQLEEGKPFSGRNGAFTGRVAQDGMRTGNYSMLFGRLNVEIISSYE